jgi:putative endonuclease
MLKCFNKRGQFKIYTGYTNNPTRRLEEHRSGKGAKFTRMYHHKIELAYLESHATQKKAMQREYFIKKKMSRAEKIALIKSYEN